MSRDLHSLPFISTPRTTKAHSRFSFAAWTVLLVLSVIAFRRERKREPGFIPPSSDGISYANVTDHIPVRSDDPYADKHEVLGHVQQEEGGYDRYSYTGVRDGGDEADAFGRPSMDQYGFEAASTRANGQNTTVGADETSRTMQLAYSDPCEYMLFVGRDDVDGRCAYQAEPVRRSTAAAAGLCFATVFPIQPEPA